MFYLHFVLTQVNNFAKKPVLFNEQSLLKQLKLKLFISTVNDTTWNGPIQSEKFIFFHSIPWNSVYNLKCLFKPANYHLSL
jgi:hypothetical protein